MADITAQEPSTNEEAPETDVESSFEEIEVSPDELIDDETAETDDSDKNENTDTEPAESEEESEDDAELEETESSDEEPEEESTTSAEDIKKHNAEMAQRRIAEKQAREQAKLDQQAKYLEEAEDNRDLALRQLQIDAYNNKVDRNKNTLENGIEKAVAGIELFRTGTPEVKEALAASLEKFERMYVKYDSNGDPISVESDVYQYLQNEADSIQRILSTGARSESKARNKAKARTETLPTRAPKEPKVDPDILAFDEEANR